MTAPALAPLKLSPEEKSALLSAADTLAAEPLDDARLRATAILDVLRRTVSGARSLTRAQNLVISASTPAQLAELLRALAG